MMFLEKTFGLLSAVIVERKNMEETKGYFRKVCLCKVSTMSNGHLLVQKTSLQRGSDLHLGREKLCKKLLK